MTIELSEEHSKALLDFMQDAKIEDTTENRNIVGSLMIVSGVVNCAVCIVTACAIKEKFPTSQVF